MYPPSKRLHSLVAAFLLLSVGWCTAQTIPATFTDRTDLLLTDNYSGVCMGIVDLNGDGKDDILRYNLGRVLNIEFQNDPNSAFTHFDGGPISNFPEWSTAVADIDRDGDNDILVGGEYDNIKLLENRQGSFFSSNLPNSSIFLQSINYVDLNEDGWIDVFACNDEGDNREYLNSTSGSISKCRQGVTEATDPRRVNMLFENDGQNNFTEIAASRGLDFGDQTWVTEFGDIDNDGDMDMFVGNHFSDSKLLLNNGQGNFIDISASSGLLPILGANNNIFSIQALFRDFNNDGYLDLIITGSDHYIFYNNGDRTFSSSEPFGTDQVESCAIGDLNQDGYLDVYAGYAELFSEPSDIPAKLFMNEG